jgi:hypothetical protein
MHTLIDGGVIVVVLLNMLLVSYNFGKLTEKVNDTNRRLIRLEAWFYNHVTRKG